MKTLLLTILVSAALVGSSRAQEILWHQDSPEPRIDYGFWSSIGPDLNGDGVLDLMVGAPRLDDNRGAVYFYSSADGTLLHRSDGLIASGEFGRRHSLAGDHDGDGLPDYLVGAEEDGSYLNRSGRVYLISSASHQVIHAFDPLDTAEDLSRCVPFPDWDGDGIEDIVVGAFGYPRFEPYYQRGYVRIFSGADYRELWIQYGEASDYKLGVALLVVDDLDADGSSDLVVGATGGGGDKRGEVFAYSGRTHQLILRLKGPADRANYGGALASPGDVDGDGCSDLLVGSPNSSNGGQVFLYSGKTGTELHVWDSPTGPKSSFGISLAVVGDLDGDSLQEYVIGSYHSEVTRGAAYLVNGRTRRYVYIHQGMGDDGDFSFEIYGRSTTGLPDVDGDGLPEYAITAFQHRNADGEHVGGVFVYKGDDSWLQADCEHCSVGDTVTLSLSGEPDALALLAVIELDGAPLYRPVTFTRLDQNGESTLTGTIPPDLAGHTVTLRAWSTRTLTSGPPKDSTRAVLAVQ